MNLKKEEMIHCVADSTVGGDTVNIGKRVNNNSDDSVLDNIPLPVPPQNLPFSLLTTPNAKCFRLHFRHHLVGDRPQHDCLFCRLPCKFLFPHNL